MVLQFFQIQLNIHFYDPQKLCNHNIILIIFYSNNLLHLMNNYETFKFGNYKYWNLALLTSNMKLV